MALRLNSSGGGSVTLQESVTAVNFTVPLPGTVTVLTDGATITPDLAVNNVFSVTLGGARTMANPTNMVNSLSGSIFIIQDGSGNRTLSWGSYWKWPNGTTPTLSTGANAIDRIDFIVKSSTEIQAVWTGNYS